MIRRVPRARMSQAKTGTTAEKEEQPNQDPPKDDQATEEEFKLDEDQVEGQPNVYVLWLKRILKTAIYFGLANLTYAVIQRSYYPDLDFFVFENQLTAPYARSAAEGIESAYRFLVDPPMTKFLPEKVPLKMEAGKKTLVLNFEGTLYSKDFDAAQGIVIYLRPGYQQLITSLINKYDIVIYSDEDTQFMSEVLMTIDPYQRYIHWFYGREFMSWSRKGPKKNLKYVNRDIRKVVVVDFTKDLYTSNLENVILLDKYNGEENDTALRDLGMFLEHLSDPKIKDVRKEIEKFGGENAVKNYRDQIQKKIDDAKKKRESKSIVKKRSWFS